MAYFLGIDGGGSQTTCVVGDEANVLGRGQSAGSNVLRVGQDGARDSLQRAIHSACMVARVDASKMQRTVAGVAGVGRPEIREFILTVLREAVGGDVAVVTDADAALHAAFGVRTGVVVVAGTGSIALGQDGRGSTARAGGWGWAISDEGSGPWIGRAAVREVFREHDAGQESQLEKSILRALHLSNREELVGAANAVPQPDFGVLLPGVIAASDAGDPVAMAIFTNAGRELAGLAKVVAGHLFADSATVRVAMYGGAFVHAPNLRNAFYTSLQDQLPGAVLLPDLADPVLGALRMARGV